MVDLRRIVVRWKYYGYGLNQISDKQWVQTIDELFRSVKMPECFNGF